MKGNHSSARSTFTGDKITTSEYEDRASNFDPQTYWRIHKWNLQLTATQAVSDWKDQYVEDMVPRDFGVSSSHAAGQEPTSPALKQPEVSSQAATKSAVSDFSQQKPYNPYEGNRMAKSLQESIDEFLERLKPSEVATSDGPWIWIADPNTAYRPLQEDTATFRQIGSRLLETYLDEKRKLQDKFPTRPPGSITRMLSRDRNKLEDNIRDMAVRYGITRGKWMLFPGPNMVDEIWSIVANETLKGTLGIAAKVATKSTKADDSSHLVCVYTANFNDTDDVKRVLRSMKRLGLVEDNSTSQTAGGRCIYYKSDAYTYLDIVSQNEFNLKSSMYSSKSMFVEMRMRGQI